MLLGIKRDDVPDEFCNKFRDAVDAMTAAMEPGSDAGARERSKLATSAFHELLSQQSVTNTAPISALVSIIWIPS